MRSLHLARILAATGLSLALPSSLNYSWNDTDATSSYRVSVSHNCPGTTDVFPHFIVTAGSVFETQNVSTQPIARGESRDYILRHDATGQSTWTFWIDNMTLSTGPLVRSLVEVTCESDLDRCYVDISNIEAVSNGFSVGIEAKNCSTIGPQSMISPTCAPLTCKVASDWQCPVENRFDHQDPSKPYPPTYLSADQSCVSNCTLYQSDEACCRNANGSEQTCTNQNLALRDMCEDAYSYAFDDERASYVYQLPLDEDTIVHIAACP